MHCLNVTAQDDALTRLFTSTYLLSSQPNIGDWLVSYLTVKWAMINLCCDGACAVSVN